MGNNFKFLRFFLYPLGFLALSAGIVWAGSTTLTTYYPAPTGNYNQLIANNIGIGTTVPSGDLTIWNPYNSGVDSLRLAYSDGNAYWMGIQPYVVGSGNVGYEFRTNNVSTTVMAMAITGAGYVGIGTTGPLAKLHVNNGTNRDLLSGSDATQLGTTGMFLGSFNDGATAYAPLSIIGSQILLYGGNVGIGVTSPDSLLHIKGSGNVYEHIQGTNAVWLNMDNGTTQWIPQVYSDQTFRIGTGVGTSQFVINTNGNVGIGTTSPAQTLDAYSTTNYQGILVHGSTVPNVDFVQGASTIPTWRVGISGYNGNAFAIAQGASVGDALDILPSGNVGIGTTVPVGKLQVLSGITAPSMTLGSTVGISQSLTYDTGGWGMYFGVDGGTGNGWIQQGRTSSATAYNLLLNPSGGSVGIGTTSPGYLLDVSGSARFTGGIIYNKNTSTYWASDGAAWNTFYTPYGGIMLGPANAGFAHIYSTNSLPFYFNTGVYAGTANTLLNTSAGNSYIAGAGGYVGIGTTSPTQLLSVGSSLSNAGSSFYNIGTNTMAVLSSFYSYGLICAGNSSGACTSTGGVVIQGSGSNAYGNTYITGSGNSYFNGGSVSIGTTTPVRPLTVSGGSGSSEISMVSTNANAYINGSDPNGNNGGSYNITIRGLASGGSAGANLTQINLDASAVWAPGTITAASDGRLKQNIKPLTGTLSKLDQLRGVSFEWNHLAATSIGNKEGEKGIGMIAQELQKVYPELVVASKNGNQEYLSIDYGKFTAVLLQAVKELKSQMNAMQDQINALQRKVKTLEKQK